MTLGDQSLVRFLADTAAATPAPGGGSAAAATCALAAALVEMAGGIEAGRGAAASVAAVLPDRARALRERTLELAERELSSYAPVLEARRLNPADPERGHRIEAALLQASASPLEIAEAAGEVAELGAAVASACDPSVRGDALAGVVLAEAAARAALALVEINLTDAGGDDILRRAQAAHRRAADARASVGPVLTRPRST